MQSYTIHTSKGRIIEEFHWPCPNEQSCSRIIVFIPGNPGLPRFYKTMLDTIHKDLGNVIIYSQGHSGQHPTMSSNVDWYHPASLEELTVQHGNFIASIRQKYPGVPLTVVAHSMGSWLTGRILSRNPKIADDAILLMPTISQMINSPSGHKMAKYFHPLSVTLLTNMAYVLKYLVPEHLCRWMLSSTKEVDAGPLATVTSLAKSPHIIRNMLTLANAEMDEIKILDRTVYGDSRIVNKLTFYWCQEQKDDWVTEAAINEIKDVCRGARIHENHFVRDVFGVPHAFSLLDRQSNYIADWVVNRIKSM